VDLPAGTHNCACDAARLNLSSDPFTYMTVLLMLAIYALLASYLPARRAIRVD
jgi:ABC-type lipoprotein release transport system permease subunit